MSKRIFSLKKLTLAAAMVLVLVMCDYPFAQAQETEANARTASLITEKKTEIKVVKRSVTTKKAHTIVKHKTAVVASTDQSNVVEPVKHTSNAILADVIAVQEDGPTPLNEQLVVDIAAKKKAAVEAHPQTGWSNFNKYIQQNAISPDGKTGAVKLTFTVNNDGSFSDFIIKSELSEVANKKAIELVKNGPMWDANTNGQAKEITLDVNFHE
jgi:hypothetical protein